MNHNFSFPFVITLVSATSLSTCAEGVISALRARIAALCATAEVEHIGATAIPGAITKGDLDVMVRVSNSEFLTVVEALKREFGIRQPENWSSCFASFGDDLTYELPVGVQLVVRDSPADDFTFFRDFLTDNPAILTAYNDLKAAHASCSSDEYRKAKHEFITKILASRDA